MNSLCPWLLAHGSSCLEFAAVVVGIISVYLSVRQNIWSWPTALVNVSLYALVFYRTGLYSDMGLQVVYFALSLYGWYEWLYGGAGHTELKVSRAPPRTWAVLSVVGVAFWAFDGWFTSRMPGAVVPYVDAATATTSLVAQYMMTRKLLENWVIWIVVDVAYVALFIWRGLYLTAFNYAIYLVLAVLGYIAWKRSMATPGRGVIRVVLTGSESTGKTTLASMLAAHYGAELVPEFVRTFAEQKQGPIEFGDHGAIARGQMALEDEHIARSNRLVVQDTDLLSTVVYCEHYFGACPEWIREASVERRPDLYLLCAPDIPWVHDGVRDRGDRREEMQALFLDAVRKSGSSWVDVSGDHAARAAAATSAIGRLL